MKSNTSGNVELVIQREIHSRDDRSYSLPLGGAVQSYSSGRNSTGSNISGLAHDPSPSPHAMDSSNPCECFFFFLHFFSFSILFIRIFEHHSTFSLIYYHRLFFFIAQYFSSLNSCIFCIFLYRYGWLYFSFHFIHRR